MATAITTYTTYAEVRASLGVDEHDLEDSTLALPMYAKELELEMTEIGSTLPADYATAKAAPSPTAAQSAFVLATELFAVYALAKKLTTSLPLFAFKQTTDGKAADQRFDNPYKEVIDGINSQYDRMKGKLTEAYSGIGTVITTTVQKTYARSLNPAYDPVTGQ